MNKKNKKYKNEKFFHCFKNGFTLIELLVVVAIIGILVSLGTARYLNIEKSSRDLRRKSDLNQYRTALENYANANGSVYPKAKGSIDVLCNTDDFAQNYLSGSCIHDVMEGTSGHSDYAYNSKDGTDYVLTAKLETRHETGESLFYMVCSNGRSGEVKEPIIADVCNL
jgi:prepilin-type N-terminal cleavage/methylation domain-containing protein